ncbi:MAG: hypothetical protein ACOH1I_06715 [Gallionellaceae bacterium]|jgi:hypothetical protein
MQNTRTYLLPDLARSLVDGSPERALSSLALRNLWHLVFDPAPTVLQLSPPDGKRLLESFLIWADEKCISMNWALHVHLLDWLLEISPWQDQMTTDHTKELLAAAAARWAMTNMEYIDARGILIGSSHFTGLAVGVWRSTTPSDRFRVVLLKIPDKTFLSGNGYVMSYKQSIWGELKWINIPK